ncbi:MAG: YqgE/AlgH family protein [Burkholderiales bacterium]|nr:YqgE/AlgH family protein [Burkholderiales bacterium]
MNRFVCALVCLLALSCPACADTAKPLNTILLVARAELPDPNFKDSVVLVMNNIGRAPAGVIINRPTRIPVARLFPEIERLAQVDDKVYFGGPVQLGMVSFLFRADKPPEDASPVLDGVYISTNRDLLAKLLARNQPMEGLRIFVGYSGWSSGQLENEIARGDWSLAPADAAAIFERAPGAPWPAEPARSGGQRT